MELSYIKEFIVLAEYKNFSKAAEELYISQPTLSKHIQAMERELGGKLFNRSTHGVSLTEFGELFLPFAIRISDVQNEYESVLQSYKKMKSSSLTIGVVHNLQYFRAIKFLVGFRDLYPDCIINAEEQEEHKLKNMFKNKRINLLTAALPSDMVPDAPFIPIAEGHIVAVISSSHPLSRKKSISLHDLENEPLIIPDRSTMFSKMILSAFKSAEIKPHIVYEGSSLFCLDLAKAGMGISLQFKELIDGQHDPELHSVDVIPYISYRYGLMHAEIKGLSPWEKKFVDYVMHTSKTLFGN